MGAAFLLGGLLIFSLFVVYAGGQVLDERNRLRVEVDRLTRLVKELGGTP